jgi:hypothetical protein
LRCAQASCSSGGLRLGNVIRGPGGYGVRSSWSDSDLRCP